MKKTILLLSSLALLSTLAVASEMFVEGTVKFGADFKELGKINTDDGVPVFVDATINNKQCIVGLVATNANKDGLISYEKLNKLMEGKPLKSEDQSPFRVKARVFSLSCDSNVKEVRGWLYDEFGNYGANNLTVGTKVKIVFEQRAERPDGSQRNKALNSSTQVQKSPKNKE